MPLTFTIPMKKENIKSVILVAKTVEHTSSFTSCNSSSCGSQNSGI